MLKNLGIVKMVRRCRCTSIMVLYLLIFGICYVKQEVDGAPTLDEKDQREPINTVVVDKVQKLPEFFSIFKLPPQIQSIGQKIGEQIKFEFLGLIDKILDRQPDDPFTTDTIFHLFKGGQRRSVPFKLFLNCKSLDTNQSESQCGVYPVNLNEILNIFDMKKRTLIIVGGYLANAPADWQLLVADKWLRLEDLNVIIVSWNKGNKFSYNKAVSNTKIVARQVTILLYYLAKLHNLDPKDSQFTDNIMIVGHSLGAHIAGFIGQDFGGKIGRITGLDPAGPSFSLNDVAHRLDRNDALLVDVIHTNADVGFKFFLGIYKPIGHVDYYANNGKWQPNCTWFNFFECNHGAVINYYLSILDHELKIFSEFDAKLRDRYRITAFKARSYDEFKHGRSMHEYCPNLSNDSFDQIQSDGPSDFDKCTMPIDVIKKPREFRKELEEKYGINFAQDYAMQTKYWFFTTAEKPYLVDHNFIKLNYALPRALKDLSAQCSMKVTYTMRDGQNAFSELDKFKPTLEWNNPQIVIPFVAANSMAHYRLIDIDTNEHDGRTLLEESILNNVYEIFPIKIKFDSKKHINPRERLNGNYVSKWDIAKSGDRFKAPLNQAIDSRICPYNLKTVRVQPLRLMSKFLMVIYKAADEKKAKAGAKPDVIFLEEGQSIPETDVSDNPKGLLNPTVYLSTVIVGTDYHQLPERTGPIEMRTPYTEYLNESPDHIPLDKLDIDAEFLMKDGVKHSPEDSKSLLGFTKDGVKDDKLFEIEVDPNEPLDEERVKAIAAYQQYKLRNGIEDDEVD